MLGDRPNQVDRLRDDVEVSAEQLVDFDVPGGEVTDAGSARERLASASRYLDSWLSGVGAAAIDNLMEDAATAEISRAQVWSGSRRAASPAERVREEIAGVEAREAAKELFARGRARRPRSSSS